MLLSHFFLLLSLFILFIANNCFYTVKHFGSTVVAFKCAIEIKLTWLDLMVCRIQSVIQQMAESTETKNYQKK